MTDAPWWTNSVNAGFILKRLCGAGVQRALQRQKSTKWTSSDALGTLYLFFKKVVLPLHKYHSSSPMKLLHNVYFQQQRPLT